MCASHCSAGVTRQATSSTGWCTTCSTIGDSRGRWGDCHPGPNLTCSLSVHPTPPHPFALCLLLRLPHSFKWRGASVGPCPLPASCAWRCGGRARTTSPQASHRQALQVPHLPPATPPETACCTLRTAAVIVVLASMQATAAAKGAGAVEQVVARAGPPDACLRWHTVHTGPARTVCYCDDRPQPCTPCTAQGPRGTAAQVFC